PVYVPITSTENPAPGGLRNLTGRVNGDGTVDVWAITSTLSASGDQRADPNQLVFIRDTLDNTSAQQAMRERFVVLRTGGYGEVLRGVSFTPGTRHEHNDDGNRGDGRDQIRERLPSTGGRGPPTSFPPRGPRDIRLES